MIHYFSANDDFPNATASFIDEDAGWWVGIQRCGAWLALAIALSASASQATVAQQAANSHQDDPAGNLSATVDEYFWQDPVQHVLAYAPPQLFSDDAIIVPQPAAFEPDEDFWQNQAAPIVQPVVVPAPWSFDEQTPALFGQPDEDFWPLQIQQQIPLVPQLFTVDELIVAQPSTFQADEDFWGLQIQQQITAPLMLWFASDGDFPPIAGPAPSDDSTFLMVIPGPADYVVTTW